MNITSQSRSLVDDIQGIEAAIGGGDMGSEEIIAGEADMVPAKRSHVSQKIVVETAAPADQQVLEAGDAVVVEIKKRRCSPLTCRLGVLIPREESNAMNRLITSTAIPRERVEDRSAGEHLGELREALPGGWA